MESPTATHSAVPRPAKLAYTAFVAVLVPVYWREYGPTNFFYFCDVALLLGLAALWRENSLLASIALVGILLPQTLWIVDFFARCFGLRIAGITDYMFDERKPLYLRGLSLFHFWLPLLLLWLVGRLGYDRRALRWTVLLGWALLLVCYFVLPAPPAPPDRPNLPVNVNYVHGFGDDRPQTWLPPPAYFALLMIAVPVLLYWPADWMLRKFISNPKTLPNAGPEGATHAGPGQRPGL